MSGESKGPAENAAKPEQDYAAIVERLVSGEAVSWEEFNHHLAVQNAGAPRGPRPGERLLEFSLPDQSGAMRALSSLARERGLLIVVVRTSHWCGYCRNQLAALNHSVAKMRAAGFGVAAIAPDAPDLVGEFAQFAKLEYPLLADEGAAYVERLGLLNPNMSSSGRQNGGRVPYPGHILLDASGVVRASEFTDDLRHRLDGASLVFEHVNAEVGEVVGAASDDVLGAELILSSKVFQGGQDARGMVRVKIAPGWSIYPAEAPAPYQGARLAVASPVLESIVVAPLACGHEAIARCEGDVQFPLRLRLKWSPPVHGSRRLRGLSDELEKLQTPPGDYAVTAELKYQACSSDGVCLPPQTLTLEGFVSLAPDIGKTRPFFAGE